MINLNTPTPHQAALMVSLVISLVVIIAVTLIALFKVMGERSKLKRELDHSEKVAHIRSEDLCEARERLNLQVGRTVGLEARCKELRGVQTGLEKRTRELEVQVAQLTMARDDAAQDVATLRAVVADAQSIDDARRVLGLRKPTAEEAAREEAKAVAIAAAYDLPPLGLGEPIAEEIASLSAPRLSQKAALTPEAPEPLPPPSPSRLRDLPIIQIPTPHEVVADSLVKAWGWDWCKVSHETLGQVSGENPGILPVDPGELFKARLLVALDGAHKAHAKSAYDTFWDEV